MSHQYLCRGLTVLGILLFTVEVCQLLNTQRGNVTPLKSDIVFVHIGKTGGSTIQKFLTDNNVEYKLVHCHPFTPKMLPLNAKVIISVRDPAERIVSAFNWRHPKGGFLAHIGKNNTPQEKILYDCFPNASTYIRALFGGSDTCSRVARESLHGPEHIGMGYEFYLKSMMPLISSLNVRVIRQDNLHTDLLRLEPWVEQKFAHTTVSTLRSSHGLRDTTRIHPPPVSDNEIDMFRALIRKEYDIYNQLLHMGH